jgi:hypothetical protein
MREAFFTGFNLNFRRRTQGMQNGKMVKEIIALQKSFLNGLFEVAAVYQDQTIKFNGIMGKKMGLSHGVDDITAHWQGALQQQRDGLKQIMDTGFAQWEALLLSEGPKTAPQQTPAGRPSEKTKTA